MKQRLKLGLAFYSDTPILLLDEPTSNLDKTGIAWYQQTVIENMATACL
jgi:ABC-type multidrug transport system ATPase subunit